MLRVKMIVTIILITFIIPVCAGAQEVLFDRYMGQTKEALVSAFGEPDTSVRNWDVINILTYNHQKFDGRNYTVSYSLDNNRVFSVYCADLQRAAAPVVTLPAKWTPLSCLGKTKTEVIADLGAPQQFSWTKPASHDNFSEEVMLYDHVMVNGQPFSLRLSMENGRTYGLQYETGQLVRLADNQLWLTGQIEMVKKLLNEPAWLRFETQSVFGAAYKNNRSESWWTEGYLADDRYVCWYTASLDNGLSFQLNFWDISARGAKIEQEKNLLRELMQEAWHKEDWQRGGELSRFELLFEMTGVAP